METIDLFDFHELQPKELAAILDRYNPEEESAEVMAEMLAECQSIGYTFDWDLGYSPFGLRKMTLADVLPEYSGLEVGKTQVYKHTKFQRPEGFQEGDHRTTKFNPFNR